MTYNKDQSKKHKKKCYVMRIVYECLLLQWYYNLWGFQKKEEKENNIINACYVVYFVCKSSQPCDNDNG